jgi:vesicle coat complex subunit
VRLSIAKQTDKLVTSFGRLVASHHLLDDLSQLLRDPEGEVKREIVHSFTKCIKLLEMAKIKEFLLPVFKDTYKDDYANFKEGVAESICEIAFLLDEHDVTAELLPILIELMKDKTSEVKIRVVEGMVKYKMS